MSPDLRFEHRAVDQPRTVLCAMCSQVVPLPTTEPWLIAGNERLAPALESFRCPHCGRRVYLDAANEVKRDGDEAADRLNDEEDA